MKEFWIPVNILRGGIRCIGACCVLMLWCVAVSGVFTEYLYDCRSRGVCAACVQLVLSLIIHIVWLVLIAAASRLASFCSTHLLCVCVCVCVCVCQSWVACYHSSILNLLLFSVTSSLHQSLLLTSSTAVMFSLLRCACQQFFCYRIHDSTVILQYW